jgi:anti-sigma-K factor RskA
MSDTYNLSQLEDIDLAAGEYALGSLDAEQKAQFEALLAVSHDTQAKVATWQEQLQQGLHDFKPIPTPKELWPRIAEQLGHQSTWHHWFNNLKLWQGLSASALALSLVLTVTVIAPPWNSSTSLGENTSNIVSVPNTSPDLNYVMYNTNNDPAWIVNASMSQQQVSIDTIAPDPMEEGKVCELWLILDSGEPISLGMLPKQGRMQVAFNSRITSLPNWQQLVQQGKLVISVEGSEGASSGYNMGPVLAEGPWVSAMAGPTIGI